MRYAGMFRVEKNFAAVFGSAFMIKMEMQLRSEQSVRINYSSYAILLSLKNRIY